MTPSAAKSFSTVLLVATVLTGCSNHDAEQPWVTYHEQIASDLGLPPIERTTPRNIDAFPDNRSRQLNVPEMRESMLNIYALRECQITSIIAARNNQLGRVAPPSQQWLYERTLWQRLTRCWESEAVHELSDENRERLENLTLQKTVQLPAVSWNAIFTSSEWEKSFSRASQPLSIEGVVPQTFSQQLAAIDYLYQMVINQFNLAWEQDSALLEHHLKTLQERPLTAELLRSLLLAEQRLNEANQMLKSVEQPSNTCIPSFQIDLQPLEQQAAQWLTAINSVFDAQSVVPPESIAAYQQTWLSMSNPNAPWQQFQTAKATHAQFREHFPDCTNF